MLSNKQNRKTDKRFRIFPFIFAFLASGKVKVGRTKGANGAKGESPDESESQMGVATHILRDACHTHVPQTLAHPPRHTHTQKLKNVIARKSCRPVKNAKKKCENRKQETRKTARRPV